MDGPTMTARIFKCPKCFQKLSELKGSPCRKCASEIGKNRIAPVQIEPSPRGCNSSSVDIMCQGCGKKWDDSGRNWPLTSATDDGPLLTDLRTFARRYFSYPRYTFHHTDGEVTYDELAGFIEAWADGYGVRGAEGIKAGHWSFDVAEGSDLTQSSFVIPGPRNVWLCAPCWDRFDYLMSDEHEIEQSLHNPSLTAAQIRAADDGLVKVLEPMLPSERDADLARELEKYEKSLADGSPRIPRPTYRPAGTRKYEKPE